jgi:hypothetical protein
MGGVIGGRGEEGELIGENEGGGWGWFGIGKRGGEEWSEGSRRDWGIWGLKRLGKG